MPFLRVIRDKRGYETTYLMHWYREGSRQRSRILYVFRTPSGVRVGREPLAPDVLRQIEARHPDIAFDWEVVRDNQQVVEPLLDRGRRRPRRDEGEAPAVPQPPPPATSGFQAPGPSEKPAAIVPPRPPIPSALQGATLDEQTTFLAEWYPIVRERVMSRVQDPMRREEMLALCEHLNATSWTDADQITTGLQHAAESLERLSRALSKRRRRPRRRPPTASPDAAASSESVDAGGEDDGGAESDEAADADTSETPSSDR